MKKVKTTTEMPAKKVVAGTETYQQIVNEHTQAMAAREHAIATLINALTRLIDAVTEIAITAAREAAMKRTSGRS